MTALEFAVMKMQHSRLIAEIAAENEAAHRESALDGWLSDHAERVRLLADEAKIIEEEIKTAISGCGYCLVCDECHHGNDRFACQDCDRDEERRKNAEGECARDRKRGDE